MVSEYREGVLVNFIQKEGETIAGRSSPVQRLTIRPGEASLGPMYNSATLKYPKDLLNFVKIESATLQQILKLERRIRALGIDPYDFQVIIGFDGTVHLLDAGSYSYNSKVNLGNAVLENVLGLEAEPLTLPQYRRAMLELAGQGFDLEHAYDKLSLSLAERMVLGLKRILHGREFH
jgi:hypothetical protein